jgi:catechol O-methyltransferase
VGYSCILFGDAVRKAGGQRYFSLERNPEFAAVISSLVDLAGLSDVVKVIVGSSDESIARLHSAGALNHIDLMFLDHYKPAYTTDLKLCEELKLVTPGSVLAADNVIKPGNPPYLEYVRSTVEEKRKKAADGGKGGSVEGFAERNVKQYAKRQGEEKFAQSAGNPNLVYKSELVNSYEPTGVPVCSPTKEVRYELTRFRMELRLRGVLARRSRQSLWYASGVVIDEKQIGLIVTTG